MVTLLFEAVMSESLQFWHCLHKQLTCSLGYWLAGVWCGEDTSTNKKQRLKLNISQIKFY
jgi:hypothetical protein